MFTLGISNFLLSLGQCYSNILHGASAEKYSSTNIQMDENIRDTLFPNLSIFKMDQDCAYNYWFEAFF